MCKEKWMYELHGSDIWQGEEFDTREECIEEAKKEITVTNKSSIEFGYKTIDKFRIGKTEDVRTYEIDADDVLERISEKVYDDVGEVAEDYLTDVQIEHEKELEEKLNEVLSAWMKKYKYDPSFYKIVDVEELEYTEDGNYEVIEKFIKVNHYTYKVEDILESYQNQYLKNYYVSYTMKHCIENLENEIKDLLSESVVK